jgi:hypothetical protein
MKKRAFAITGSCILVLAIAGAIFGSSVFASPARGGSSGVFQQDKGKFDILLDGNSVGQESFEISSSGSNWIASGTTELKPPKGKQTKVTGKLTLLANGTPVAYDWTSQSDKTNGAHIDFANGVAKITLQLQGARPFEQDLTFGAPLIAVLDNNLYHQYAVLARIYDWSKRGAQSLPVLIPQELTPGMITIEANGTLSADGKSYEGLKVTTSDLEVQLYLDSNHRLMRLEVPAAKVSVVRE